MLHCHTNFSFITFTRYLNLAPGDNYDVYINILKLWGQRETLPFQLRLLINYKISPWAWSTSNNSWSLNLLGCISAAKCTRWATIGNHMTVACANVHQRNHNNCSQESTFRAVDLFMYFPKRKKNPTDECRKSYLACRNWLVDGLSHELVGFYCYQLWIIIVHLSL